MFKLGAKVILELNKNNSPRWDYSLPTVTQKATLIDTGYSGKFIKAIISNIHTDTFSVLYYDENGNIQKITYASSEEHESYEPEQWDYPGFVREIEQPKQIVACICGSHKTYGIGNGAHSRWCNLYS